MLSGRAASWKVANNIPEITVSPHDHCNGRGYTQLQAKLNRAPGGLDLSAVQEPLLQNIHLEK